MPIVETWDETTPVGASESIRQGDDRIREFKRAVRERLRAGGHKWEASGLDAQAGRHICGGDPDGDANQFIIYEEDEATAAVTVDTNDAGIQSVSLGSGNSAVNPYTFKTRTINVNDITGTGLVSSPTITATTGLASNGTLDVTGLATFNGIAQILAGRKLTVRAIGDIDGTTTANDVVLVCSPVSNRVLNLVTAVGNSGLVYFIRKNGTGGNLTIDPNGAQLINGAATVVISDVTRRGVAIVCDGANWFVFAELGTGLG